MDREWAFCHSIVGEMPQAESRLRPLTAFSLPSQGFVRAVTTRL